MQNPRASRRCSDLISLNCWLCLVSETTWNDMFLESATSPCCQCWVVSNSLWPHELYVACQTPLSMGFSRQEYWSGLPLPSPGDLPNPGMEPTSLAPPALAGGFFTTSATWEVCIPDYLLLCVPLKFHILCYIIKLLEDRNNPRHLNVYPVKVPDKENLSGKSLSVMICSVPILQMSKLNILKEGNCVLQ